MRLATLPSYLRGPELLRVFFLDLLGRDTAAALILKSKLYWAGIGGAAQPLVTYRHKAVVIVALVALDTFMITQCFVWAYRRDPMWQYSLCLGAILVICLLFLVWMTMETIILHYALPSLVGNKVREMRLSIMRLIENLFSDPTEEGGGGEEEGRDSFHTPPRASKGNRKSSSSKRYSSASTHSRAIGHTRVSGFSSSDHFFVAGKVAPLVAAEPELRLEAALILSHRDASPGPLRAKWLLEAEAERSHALSSMPGGNVRSHVLTKRDAGPHKNKAAPLTDRALQHISPRFLTKVDITHIANRRLALHPTLGGGKDRRTLAARRFVRRQRFRLFLAKYSATVWWRMQKLSLAFGMLPDIVRIFILRALQPVIVTVGAFTISSLLDAPLEVQAFVAVVFAFILLTIVMWWHWSATEENKRKSQVLPELDDEKGEKDEYEVSREAPTASARGALGTSRSGFDPEGSTNGVLNGMRVGEDVDEYLSDIGSIDEVSSHGDSSSRSSRSSRSSSSSSSSSDAYDVAKRRRKNATKNGGDDEDIHTSSESSIATNDVDVSESSDSDAMSEIYDEDDGAPDGGNIVTRAISIANSSKVISSRQSDASSSEFSLGQSIGSDGNQKVHIRYRSGGVHVSQTSQNSGHEDESARSIEASDDIIDALYGIGDNNKDVTEGSHSNSDISSEGERMLAHHYHMQGGDEEAGHAADAPAESLGAVTAAAGEHELETQKPRSKRAKITHAEIVEAAMRPFEYKRPTLSSRPTKNKAGTDGFNFNPKASPTTPLVGNRHNELSSDSDSDGVGRAPLLFQRIKAAEGFPVPLVDLKAP